jgi:N-acetylmuramoyl-L-alanine amidase
MSPSSSSVAGSTAATTTTSSVAPRLLPPTSTPVKVESGSLSGTVVAIDPGHNGGNGSHVAEISAPVNIVTKTITCDTTGTEGADGYTESSFNLDVALRLRSILQMLGARVVMTRTSNTDWGPCINERAAIGNQAHANVAISIHADGNLTAGARGFTVLEPALIAGHNDAIISPSAALARDVRDAFVTTGMPISNYSGTGGIVVRNDLGGLNLSTVPKVFVECGNMRNPLDLALFESATWRQRAAQSIANGLVRFLGR